MVQLLSGVSRMDVAASSIFGIVLFLCSQITAMVNWTCLFIGVVKLFNEGTSNALMDTYSKCIQQRHSTLLCAITCKGITLTPPTVQWRNQECSDGHIFKVDPAKAVRTAMRNHLRSDHPKKPQCLMQEPLIQLWTHLQSVSDKGSPHCYAQSLAK